MTYVFAAFALVIAILSLRDAIRAKQGRIDEMTLQLPGVLKKRIRGVIRKGAKARNFVIAAFVSGIIISFLELACTGQVYVPIIYQIQRGSTNAILYLLIYNLAFILPLVIIFILAFFGMTSDSLIAFQKRHTAGVKFATAILVFRPGGGDPVGGADFAARLEPCGTDILGLLARRVEARNASNSK